MREICTSGSAGGPGRVTAPCLPDRLRRPGTREKGAFASRTLPHPRLIAVALRG
jgi:hypothetical protein